MSSNISKDQECTNISINTCISDKPSENNDISIVVSKENYEQEKNPEGINFDINSTFPKALDDDPSDNIESSNENEDLVNSLKSKKKGRKAIFDSDSENNDESSNIVISELNSDNDEEEPQIVTSKKLKRIAFINSDSEHDDEDNSNQDSGENVVEYKSVDQSSIIDEHKNHSENQKNIISALCDSESSDESNEETQQEEGDISDTELSVLQSNEIISNSRKRKNKQKCEDKGKKMTVKKALEQRKEILAESQRRVRESRVSLPYHKPKPRSLKEFLQNRPKLASPLSGVSQSGSPSLSIKMSMKQLEIITQKMKEREKVMEEFYKSESESEEEGSVDNPTIANIHGNTTSANDIKESQNDCSLKNEIPNQENIPHVKLKEETENVNSTHANEKATENLTDHKKEETIETLETECIAEKDFGNVSTELETLKENEKNEVPYLDQCTEESDKSVFKDAGNSNNPESLTTNNEATEEKSENEPKKNDKFVLLSDILIVPPKKSESTNKWNLDAELLELASEVKKDETDKYESYEFNLDGIEDEMDNVENGKIEKKEYKTEGDWKKRKSELLMKLGELKPRLSIGPNEVIDLENGIAMPDGISELRERFTKHNKSKKHSHKKKISILSVADGKIHKETLSLNVDDNEDEAMKPLEIPGFRLQKLREELQHQIAQRRSDLWKEKLNNQNKKEKVDGDDDENDEKYECGEKDILDDEEEENFTDPEEDDEELEENDCDMSDNKKVKSNFLDEEAEESDLEEIVDEEDEIEENEIEENEEESEEIHEEDEEADVEDNGDIVVESSPKKKVLKRIIRPFDEDSDDETESNHINKMENEINSNSDSENLLSSLQPVNFKTRAPLLSPAKSEEHFSTPITYMTGLKNLNTSGSRFVPPDSVMEEGEKAFHRSEIYCTNEENDKKMDESQAQSQDVQTNQISGESNDLSTQDVLDICSGQFPNSVKSISSPEISTQQLKEVFTGSMKCSSDFNTQDVDAICSGGFTGASQVSQVQEKEIVLDDNDEHLISQLIDEDELENFKKKFESPGVNGNIKPTKKNSLEGVEEVVGTGGVIDSDEDDEKELKLRNKKRKRLAFSDDEDSSMSETAQEETIDLQDDEDLGSNVEYDSEENEVETNGENIVSEGITKENIKASDFFEEEAELSESEWGSEDEDERNLDDLEFEKGDEENFDDDKLRTDIEKIQMKQMLDEDNREVKLLQELLLEDGELHGTGRQRQFKWKNIDAVIDDTEEKKDDDDYVYLEEDESEEQWRKERHKREMMKLKHQSQEEDSLIIESQSLSFTHRSLKIKSQTILGSQVSSSEVDSSPKVKQPYTLLNKRGSFLSRGEKILQKIAETTKMPLTSKNTNRIVFQTVDEDTKKRKASAASLGDSTPVALKKLRLSGLSPGLNKGKSMISKSLFEKILH